MAPDRSLIGDRKPEVLEHQPLLDFAPGHSMRPCIAIVHFAHIIPAFED
jgi:hypothetical protein